MPYSEKEYQTTNINYLNKDFTSLKSSLMEYAKTYFPNTYKDFNETSPGMMLIEMSAYVGDVLSFYIDQQYKEMMLPLAEERRNITNMASMFGYKVKPTAPAYTDITIKQTVDVVSDNIDDIQPQMSDAQVIDKGMVLSSTSDTSVKFETLDVVDFTISGGLEYLSVSSTDANGIPTEYTLTKKIRTVGSETKTKNISIGRPQKFKRVTLPETNIIEILDVYDSSDNRWYEVDYLAQNRIPKETHWYDEERTSAYHTIMDTEEENIPIPYTLEYINVSKRFITEIGSSNLTSLVFGNGVLNQETSGSLVQGYYQSEQAGITIPGDETNFDTQISPLLGSSAHGSMGEIPQNTTLTIRYRVGGGISSNVPSDDLTVIDSLSRIVAGNSVTPTVTNLEPARGGQSQESVEEIRKNAQANFTTQRRCVTREDYKARVLSMPGKFGAIAKVSVRRRGYQAEQDASAITTNLEYLNVLIASITTNIQSLNDAYLDWEESQDSAEFADYGTIFSALNTSTGNASAALIEVGDSLASVETTVNNPTIEVHILSYDRLKNLVYSPPLLQNNLNNYLLEYRMITDEFAIYNGFIINFGVAFEVVAHRQADKHDVKLRCINKIIEYFNIDKMKMRQPIYTNDLIYEIMGINGVRAVNYLELTQNQLSTAVPAGIQSTIIFDPPLWDYSSSNPHPIHTTSTEDDYTAGSPGSPSSGDPNNSGKYGYFYDFNQFYDGTGTVGATDGVILPSVEPAVFELKNPNENIKGSVV